MTPERLATDDSTERNALLVANGRMDLAVLGGAGEGDGPPGGPLTSLGLNTDHATTSPNSMIMVTPAISKTLLAGGANGCFGSMIGCWG